MFLKRKNKYLYTDFADELIEENKAHGYVHQKKKGKYVTVSHIHVLDKENPLQKEPGNYVSISFTSLKENDQRKELIETIRYYLSFLMKEKSDIQRILVVGLGNRSFVSDALGPKVAGEVLVTAHLFQQEDRSWLNGMRNVAVLAPGVMGQTGLESSVIIENVAKAYQPDLIVAVDALATRYLKRINRVIQMSDTGIQPGSGIGNHRRRIDQSTVHVPVIAIGVATVTSIQAIIEELLEKNHMEACEYEKLEQNMIVTPKSMDEELTYLSMIIASGMNRAFHSGLESG